MKKALLIFILMIVTTLSTFSQDNVFTMRAVSFKYSIDGGEFWTNWTQVSIPVVLDFKTNRFVVYSSEEQILDFVHLNKTEDLDCITFDGYATDSNYKKVIIVLSIYQYHSYLSIMYDDLIYTYKLIDD